MIRRWWLAAAAVALLGTACGGESGPPIPGAQPVQPAVAGAPAVVVVAGAHANAPRPVPVPEVLDVVAGVVDGHGTAALVVSDGVPTVERTAVYTSICQSTPACEQEATDQMAGTVAAIAGLRAGDPENDLLGALVQAGRALPEAAGPRTVVVIDSGLATAGELRFQEPGVLAADPAEVAEQLAGLGALPELDGATVVLSGLGDVVAPQPALRPAQRANLAAIWTAVLTRSGASEVRILDTPLAEPATPDLPAVSEVPVPEVPTFTAGENEVVLSEAVVGFLPDTAELRDPAGAAQVLRPLADRVRGEDLVVELVGTTSSAGGGSVPLSLARAEAIKALLVADGVAPDRITTRGAGYVADPPDNVDGMLIPGAAAENRRVEVRLAPPG